MWHDGTGDRDFDQLYLGAKAIHAGISPYDAGVLRDEDGWPTRLPYPLPSVLLVLRLTFLPILITGSICRGRRVGQEEQHADKYRICDRARAIVIFTPCESVTRDPTSDRADQ